MNRFSQFSVRIPDKGFEGPKIKISKILNREIVVHAFRIEDSKVKQFQEKGSNKCLHLQISINNEMHIVFTSGVTLIAVIQQISADNFPFTTTIIEENDRYIFT
jgi:hypothetical protein